MTGLDVAEPQPLWLSLQHTPPSLGISDTPAHAAVGAAAEPADVLVVIADSAAVLAEFADPADPQLHLFGFQFPLVEIKLIYSILTCTYQYSIHVHMHLNNIIPVSQFTNT